VQKRFQHLAQVPLQGLGLRKRTKTGDKIEKKFKKKKGDRAK
jgi:hypothetical protein